MAWKQRHRLLINGGPGLPKEYFRKHDEPTESQLARRALEKRLSKLDIPKHYARAILALKLRQRAQGHLLQRIADLREQLKQASGRLVEIRDQIKQLLKGEELKCVNEGAPTAPVGSMMRLTPVSNAGKHSQPTPIAPLELEGRPYPQPLTLAQAIERGFVLEAREGWGRVFYLRSARVKLILVVSTTPKKEP